MKIINRIKKKFFRAGYASKPLRIVIYGQYKTGTTACFFKVRNSLPQEPHEFFESTEYIPPEDNSKYLLAKVIVPPNPYLYANGENMDQNDLQELVRRAEQGVRSFSFFDKKIYLVRDPRDWIISGILFLTQQRPEIYENDKTVSLVLEMLRQKENKPGTVSMLDILKLIYPEKDVREFTSNFVQEQNRWLLGFEQELADFVTWKYEDMVRNKADYVEDYLGFSLKGESTPDKRFAHVARTKGSGNWRNWMTPEDVRFFRPLFSPYMERHGYDEDWQLNSVQEIDPSHCSQYVQKVINMKRNKQK